MKKKSMCVKLSSGSAKASMVMNLFDPQFNDVFTKNNYSVKPFNVLFNPYFDEFIVL